MYQVDINELKKELEKRKISFDQLAEVIGIDRSTLYRRIKSNRLRIVDMQRIVEYCNFTMDEACRIFLALKVA